MELQNKNKKKEEKRYPSDLSDEEWVLIKAHYADQYTGQGRPPSKDLREIWNGIVYVSWSGCSWRMLPKCFPAWRNVYKHLHKQRRSGKLEKIMQDLHGKARLSQDREVSPSVGIVDSQSITSCSPKKNQQRVWPSYSFQLRISGYLRSNMWLVAWAETLGRISLTSIRKCPRLYCSAQ